MKLSKYLVLAVLPALVPTVRAQIQPVPDFVSMRVIESENPIFPQSLKEQGVTEGFVRLAISIDAEGKLGDMLDICHSRQELADTTMRALKRWKFKAAQFHGEPRGVVTDILFEFEAKGVVVTMNATQSVDTLVNRIKGEKDCTIASLSSIDRIPVPTVIAPAHAPLNFRGKASITVEFYIDTEGRVRLPCVLDSANEDLADRAVDAVRQWKFEPPTHRGTPVLVKAHQVFNFDVK